MQLFILSFLLETGKKDSIRGEAEFPKHKIRYGLDLRIEEDGTGHIEGHVIIVPERGNPKKLLVGTFLNPKIS